MAPSKNIFRAFFTAALIWSGASAAQAATAMPLGGAALAPQAYVIFCERNPADCGDDAAQVQAAARHIRFQTLLGPAAINATPVTDAPVQASGLDMDRRLLNQLVDTNVAINDAIRPATDKATYGVDDFWAAPIESGRGAGDCEDYVLEKIRALVAQGVARSNLNLAIAVTRSGEAHAVLLVTTSDGEYVLDNLRSAVLRWNDTGYSFKMRQVNGEAFNWVRVVDPSQTRIAARAQAQVRG